MSTPIPPVPPAPPAAPPAPTPQAAISTVQADIKNDVVAVKGALSNVAAQARTEYEALAEPAKAKLHTLLNDLETAFNVSLGGIHTLFGEKAPTVAGVGAGAVPVSAPAAQGPK